jgi:dephospho-CoA kinase
MVLRIGLTGSIGCGKSVVGAMLRDLGADYVDADGIVHDLLAPGSSLIDTVAERFGQEVLRADGGVDRGRLAAIVFTDQGALRDLECLLHPAVRVEIRRRVKASHAPAIVVDAIKLIEGGLYREVDSVWVVTCDPAVQLERLTGPRGMTETAARARIGAQPAQESRLQFANVVIENDGSLEATRRQVRDAWRRTLGVQSRHD